MKSSTLQFLAIICLALLVTCSGDAQTASGISNDVLEQDIPSSGTRIIKPTEYRTVQLDLDGLDEILLTAPSEVIGQPINSNVILRMPNPY